MFLEGEKGELKLRTKKDGKEERGRRRKGAYLSMPLFRVFTAPFTSSIMSTAPSTSSSQSNFASIFNTALESYRRKTKKDLVSHPLLPTLQSCDTPDAVLTVLREQIPAFSQSQNCNDGLTTWVTPTVNVLYSFSKTVSQGVGLVSIMAWHFVMKNLCSNIQFQAFPPATVIFAGISVLISVRVLYLSLVRLILTLRASRQLKKRAPARTT